MKRWWQVPALLTPFLFSSLSHSRCIGSLWVQLICSEYLYRLPGPSPVLWDGGGWNSPVFFPTFQKLPFYSYFGETPWGSSHIEAGSAQSQAQLSTAQPHPKSRCHGSCPHICSACPPQKKSVLVLKWWSCVLMCVGHGSPTPSPAGWWMAQTGLAQETQDFVEAADVQVLSRFIQGGMTLKR